MTNPAQAKFQLIKDTPLPHACAFCGHQGSGRDEFVDGNLSYDYVGAVLICSSCACEIAWLVGFSNEKSIQTLTKDLDSANARISELSNQLSHYIGFLGNVNNVRHFNDLLAKVEELAGKASRADDSVSEEAELGTFK